MYASVISSTLSGNYVKDNPNKGAALTWTKLPNPPRAHRSV
jgi:hypothetical protein